MRAASHIDRAAVITALVLLAATSGHRTPRPRSGEDCRLAQIWYAGDVHYSERLQLYFDGKGAWDSGGYAEDAHRGHEDFAWTEDDAALTVTTGGATTTVPYRLARRSGHCYLMLDTNPFLGERGFTVFSDWE